MTEKQIQETERTEVKDDAGGDEASGDNGLRGADVTEEYYPPDGGWGWMVALGSLIMTTMVFSLPFSFAILYSGYLLSGSTSATTTAWIYNAFLVMMNSSMAFANALAQEFGCRTVGCISVLMWSVGTLLAAFFPSVYFLYFSFSLLAGVGAGIGVTLAYTVLPPYFDKKSGRANAFVISGAPLAQAVFAPLIRYLLELYTFRGAALVYSGILLNGLVGVALFQPVKWHLKPPLRPHQDAMQTMTLPAQDSSSAAAATPEAPYKGPTLQVPPPTAVNRLRQPFYGSETSVVSAASTDIPLEWAVLSTEEEELKQGCAKTLWKTLRRVSTTFKSDMTVIRQLRAVILGVTYMLTQTTGLNFVMLLPLVVRAADYSLKEAAWCVSLVGIANGLVRLVLSPIADCRGFSVRCSLMAGYGLKVLAMAVVSFTSELWVFAAASVVFGTGIAASVGMANLANIKYMGMRWLAQTFGFKGLMTSLAFLTIGPLLGVIRDATGNYTVSLLVMMSLDLLSLCLWLLMPAAQARDARKEQDSHKDAS